MEKIDLNIKASVRKFYLQTSTRKQFRYLILGGIVGVLSSISAIGFRECIGLVTDLLFDFKNGVTSFEDAIKKVPVWQLMLFPTIIGSFVAWFTKTFAAEAQGHGVPEIMEAISIRRGVIKARVVFVKIIASAASIGSGFSVGREGPSAIIGATIGSVFGQWLRFPVGRMKMLVGAGSAAGIAAVFNAPLAGTVFALELIVRNFSVNDITPIIFSAMVATVVSHYWFGDVHDLFTQVELTIHHPMEFALYAGLGLVAGLLGIIFTKTLYAVEDYAHKLKFPSYVKGAIGGLVIGLTLIYMPLLAGPANWEAIGKAMTEVHNGEVANLVLVLALLKVIITPISLATGASGGIFAPSLMIGGGLGGAYGYYAHKFFPQYTDSPGAYGVIGMGALVAAVTQAPLTAITIIFEMTHNMSVILPMIISSGIALGIFVHFMPGSIYTLKLQRRGINIEFGRERGVLENVLVKTVMETVDEFFYLDDSISSAIKKFSLSTRSTLPVVDRQGIISGIVSFWDLREIVDSEELKKPISSVMKTDFQFTCPNQNLYQAFVIISAGDFDYLPVVENAESKKLLGKLSRHRVLQVYKNQLTTRGIIEQSEVSGHKA